MTTQRFAIVVLSMVIVAAGAAVALSRVHAQTDFTVLPDGTTVGTTTPVEGVDVAPDGTVLTGVVGPSALILSNGVLLNTATTGTVAEKTNFSLLYGKLEYMSSQLAQLQDACGKR